MKKKRMMVVFAVAAALGARAATETVGGYTWTYRINGDTAEIYNNGCVAISPNPTGAVTIPAALDGKPVTGIGENAFEDCDSLASVTIPNTVTNIGECAFRFCHCLASVDIPDGVVSIGDNAFAYSGLTNVVIPNSVTTIGRMVFDCCSNLKSATVGDGITNFGHKVFAYCGSLVNVVIPPGATNIGDYMFAGCSSLTSVTIPDSVTNIESCAFEGCSSLTSVTIPDSVTNIESCAFEGCSSLTSVTIPDSVTNIESWAFSGCSSLTSVTIPDSVTSIGYWAFEGCSSLTSVTLCQKDVSRMSDLFSDAYQNISVKIADTVERIANGAFDGCKESVFDKTSIPGVHLVDGWTVGHDPGISGNLDLTGIRGIADGAFEGCDLLTHVKIPNGVKTIGANAFNGCAGMRSIQIPPSVALIGGNAFGGCAGLGAVVISDVAAWARIDFEGWGANPLHSAHSLYLGERLLTDVTLPGDILHIGPWQFYGANSITNFTLLKGVESIGDGAFEGCSGLKQITIPSSITNIGFSAFASCTSLNAVRAESVLSWCRIRFDDETANPVSQASHLYFTDEPVTGLTIPHEVRDISQYAFSGCDDLVYVVIPETVMRVGSGAFRNCSRLKWVWCQGDSPAVEGGIYEGTPEELITYVPDGTTGWLFMDHAVLPNDWPQNDSAARAIAHGAFDAGNPPRMLTFKGNLASLYAGCEDRTEKRFVLNGAPIGDFPAARDFYHEYYAWGEWTLGDTTWYRLNDGAYYAFDGWWTALNGGMQITTNTVVGNDATYYAHWQKMWEVGWHSDEGWFEESGAYFATNGCKIGKMAVVQNNGRVFAGWFSAVDGGRKITPDTIMDESFARDGVIQLYARWATDDGGVPTPGPGAGTPSRPDGVPTLYETVAGEAPSSAASVYDGYLVDAYGNIKGSIQVKVGKPNPHSGVATVKATLVGPDGRRTMLRASASGKAWIQSGEPTTVRLTGGETCEVMLGAEGLSGFYGAYLIDGARNFFTSKDRSEQAAANDILARWQGALVAVWDGGIASVALAKKGKAKVSVTLANGAKATGNTQLLVGTDWLCVPVVVARKASLAFALWLPADGGRPIVAGLGDAAVVGRAGALKAGAKFRIDGAAPLWAQLPGQVLTAYLPDGVPVEAGARWTVAGGARPGKVVYRRGTMQVDDEKLGSNPSALKLAYRAKDGSFKGTFKVYSEVNGRLKAVTVNVSGVVVDGIGHGAATIRKSGSVAVFIR